MRPTISRSFTAIAAAAAVALSAGAAEAACKKMGFLVNDYGKDGPTKDAQDLLDKHVAEWAAQNGIKNYTIGKKDVSCELFLDFIVFDEHTCTASANVCWDEPGKAATSKSAKTKEAPAATKSADGEKKSSNSMPPAAEKTADAPAVVTPAAAIERGTVTSEPSKPAATTNAATEDDAAARAAAAAERAAEAAERAAAAAEKAAAAAKTTSAPSQLEMPGFGAGQPAQAAPSTPVEPKS